jgi:hypothetical protein
MLMVISCARSASQRGALSPETSRKRRRQISLIESICDHAGYLFQATVWRGIAAGTVAAADA